MTRDEIRNTFAYSFETDEVRWLRPQEHRLEKPRFVIVSKFGRKRSGYLFKGRIASLTAIQKAFQPENMEVKWR